MYQSTASDFHSLRMSISFSIFFTAHVKELEKIGQDMVLYWQSLTGFFYHVFTSIKAYSSSILCYQVDRRALPFLQTDEPTSSSSSGGDVTYSKLKMS